MVEFCTPYDKKDKKDECFPQKKDDACNVYVDVKCKREDKKPWVGEKCEAKKEIKGCNVYITVYCDEKEDCKPKDRCPL